jgi:hypothetical protein
LSVISSRARSRQQACTPDDYFANALLPGLCDIEPGTENARAASNGRNALYRTDRAVVGV